MSCPGWKTSIAHVTSFSDLPANAQTYVRKVEDLIGVRSEYAIRKSACTVMSCYVSTHPQFSGSALGQAGMT